MKNLAVSACRWKRGLPLVVYFKHLSIYFQIATFDDEIGSSKESSMNEDSGLGSQVTGDTDTLHGIDILDISPRSGQKLRKITSAPPRRSLRDDDDDPNVITEILPISKVVARASLKSIASLGVKSSPPQQVCERIIWPHFQNKNHFKNHWIIQPFENFVYLQLSARGSIKSARSASSDEFHNDLGLFRDYGEGLDDRTEEKVYIDCKTAEKSLPTRGRFMKDYGPGEQDEDEDWGLGEAMAEGEWKDVVSGIVIGECSCSGIKYCVFLLFYFHC